MASINDSSIKFFSKANSDQWLFVLSQYKEVFKVRAQATRGSKKSGPQEAIKLDNWYQDELPKLLQSRKDKHVRHEELVQITKWKLWRTKNRAGLLDLVRMNTETAVKQVSTKAFKKCPTNLHGAISALVNLKGIGVATASAILCACFPEICPFMADECLDSVPGIENTNYTVNEFIAFADQIKACCERLQAEDPTAKWTPHKVELTLWTHYWIKEMKLNLLEKMPTPDGLEDEMDESGSNDVKNSKSNGDSHKLSSSSTTNGSGVGVGGGGGNGEKVLDEDSNISVPVSNASEVEEGKSNEEEDEEDDDSRSGDVARRNNGTSRNMSKSSLHMINNSNTNSSSAYNCIEDSNLSYSNLSSDDLNNSTTENTADNTLDGPTNLTTTTTTTTTITSNNSNNSNFTTNNNSSSNSNNSNNCSSSSANVSTTTTTTTTASSSSSSSSSASTLLSPLAPPPPPPVAAVPVAAEEESESISTTNNGHVDVSSNGGDCKNMNRNNEIRSETVCSSMDDVVSSNSLKRPLEEISSTGDGLEDGSIDKKTRIE